MTIDKIEIKNFGKLKNFTLDLKDGVQVICGPNEFGKSTIMEFIKLMFYGRIGGEKSGIKDKTIRQKYVPWDGSSMAGAVEFTHDGSVYRLQKEISAESPSKDKILFQNKSNGQAIKLGKKEEPGEWTFGLDLKSFERSSYIGEIGKITADGGKESQDSLADKIISNLASSGEADVSQSLIIKRLDDAIRDLEWARGTGGKIAQTKNSVYSLQQKIQDELKLEQEQEQYKNELSKIAQLRNEKKVLESQLSQLRTQKELSKVESTSNLVRECEEYKKQKQKFFEKKKSKNKIGLVIGCTILALGIILMFVTKGIVTVSIWFFPLLAAYFCYLAVSNFKNKKEYNNFEDLLIQKLKMQMDSDEEETPELMCLENRLSELVSMDLEEEYLILKSKTRTVKVTLGLLVEDLKFQKSKLKNMQQYLAALKMAKAAIEKSADEIRKNFNPKLDLKTSYIFERLTCGKYKKVHVQKNYQMFVANESVDRLCDNLSSGTIDQAYLSLRMAISELISNKTAVPLILDDVFMQYDNDRLDCALKFLKNYSDEIKRQVQIILFTCHKHIVDSSLKSGISVL